MNNFKTPTTFSQEIERLAVEHNTLYKDTILWYCEQNGLEIELAAKLINKSLKALLEREAEELNLLKEKKHGVSPTLDEFKISHGNAK